MPRAEFWEPDEHPTPIQEMWAEMFLGVWRSVHFSGAKTGKTYFLKRVVRYIEENDNVREG